MSYRIGGEAEKNANLYEDNVLIHYYGQMLEGKYLSVMSESFDSTLEQGGDIYLRDNENQMTVVQAKSRHGNDDAWSVDTLIDIGIIKNACHHIIQGRKFVLVSPLSYIFLKDLCRHAIAFNSYADFRKEFLTKSNSQNFIKLETEIKKYFNDIDIIKFYKYFSLNRIDDDAEKFIIDFQNSIKAVDGGYNAFQLLRHYAIKNDKLSQEIYANELWKYLSENGVKKYVIDEPHAARQIDDLCKEYKANIGRKLINNKSYQRKEFPELIKKVSNGNIIILHGKAGSGKSGIVYQLCEHLDNKNELYLPISLDARMPSGNAHEFGKQLGLSTSPVLVLSKLAYKRIGYLIIDQLDAIRWNYTHSTSAFSVCCELVKEALYYGNVKLIFVCRTIDAEKVLRFFEDNTPKLSDCSIDVGSLMDSEVQEIIGENVYSKLTPNVRKMLTNINNLKMFMNLANDTRIEKASDIIREYINKKLYEIQDADCSEVHARKLIHFMVNKMRDRNTQMIPRNEIENKFGCGVLEKFCSCGISEEINSNIRFTHQSILDYYFAQELENEISNGGDVIKIISKHNNTAIKDYDVLKQYFEFVESNSLNFAKLMEQILFSTKICSFIRHIALESFRTTLHADFHTVALAIKVLTCKQYGKKYIYYLTIGNYAFAREYVKTSDFLELKNSSELADQLAVVDLLIYLNSQNEYYFQALNDYIKSMKDVINVISHLFYQIDNINSSDAMFNLKIDLLTYLPNQPNHIDWENILSINPSRAGKYLEYIFTNNLDYDDRYNWKESHSQLINVVKSDYKKYLCIAQDYLISSCNEWELNGYDDFKFRFAKAMAKNILEVALEFATNDEILELLYSPHALFINTALSYMAHSKSERILCIFELLINKEYLNTMDFMRHRIQLGLMRKIVENCCLSLNAADLARLIVQIKSYKSPKLLQFAKDRFTQRKDGYYYHFFEEEQKILLCAIPIAKLDDSTREYVRYLSRKFPSVEYYNNFSDYMIGECRSVVSGIAKKWIKFSAKTWVQILINPRTGKRSKAIDEIDESGNYVEYGRDSFARTISMAAGVKQTMFVEIALRRNDIPRDFINAICSGLSENEEMLKKRYTSIEHIDVSDVGMRLEVFKKYYDLTDKYFLQSFVNFIEHNDVMDTWVENKLIEIAQNPDKYETAEMNTWRANWDRQLDSLTAHDLEIEKINRVQTCAITVLANTLFTKKSLNNSIRSIIDDCCNSVHPVLLFSAVDLIYPVWNFDKEFTLDSFIKLINKDLRVLCGHTAVYLLDHAVVKHSDKFHDILDRAIAVDGNYLETLGPRIAYYYCYYNIYGDLTKKVLRAKPELILSCCTDVIKRNNDDEKQNRAKKLLLSLEPEAARSTSPHSIIDIILDSNNNEKFSISLVKKMMPLKQHEWFGFLTALNELDCLSKRSGLIFGVCDIVTAQPSIPAYEVKILVDVVVKLYAELYDMGECKKWKKCLQKINKIYDTFVIDTLCVVNKI